jgi:hypothetical protein
MVQGLQPDALRATWTWIPPVPRIGPLVKPRLHRRRADPGVDAHQHSATSTISTLRSHGRPGARGDQAGERTSPPTTLIGGQRREDAGYCSTRRAWHPTTSRAGVGAPALMGVSQANQQPGTPAQSRCGNRQYLVETGSNSCAPPRTCAAWWWGWQGSRPIFLRQVADGRSTVREEPSQYVRSLGEAPASRRPDQSWQHAARLRTPSLAPSRSGTNAVTVIAEAVLAQAWMPLKGTVIPVRRGRGGDARLRRDRHGEIQRAALPHGDRGGLGDAADRRHAGLARIGRGLRWPSR